MREHLNVFNLNKYLHVAEEEKLTVAVSNGVNITSPYILLEFYRDNY
jgi:hypothetical protein